jgi:periplasmic divalent cation tolerance protein
MTADTDVLMVYVTFPDADTAADVSGALVTERLAACANLVTRVRSIYEWQGEVCDDAETLAIIKTTAARFEALRARVVALHPYECPEVLGVPVGVGHDDYLQWVRDCTTG